MVAGQNGNNFRVLIIDDNLDIHSDFEKVLVLRKGYEELERIESLLFNEAPKEKQMPNFEVEFASQGKEGYEKVLKSLEEDNAFAMAFVDIRMPPGWNGVETVQKIWEIDPKIEIVFCSAYSDFSLSDIYSKIINRKNEFLVIKKPFDVIEIRQTATSMCQVWNLKHKLEKRLEEVESQLIHADKMASIGQLAAGVAHEINNPVGYINSNIYTLKKYVNELIELIDLYQDGESLLQEHEGLFNEVKAHKEKIELDFLKEDLVNLIQESCEGVEHVKRIIQNLKDFSHRGSQSWDQYDLNKGITSTLNIIQNELKSRNIEIELSLGKVPLIDALGAQINQIILNFLINALQSIEDVGKVKITTTNDYENVYFSIADTGIGIDEKNIKRIFEPFYTTKIVGQGTGLGLYLSYGIVQKHSGDITVTSVVGGGTTFKIALPIKQEKQLSDLKVS